MVAETVWSRERTTRLAPSAWRMALVSASRATVYTSAPVAGLSGRCPVSVRVALRPVALTVVSRLSISAQPRGPVDESAG